MKTTIFNADDFGLSCTVNEAIKECFAKNIINRTTIMTNMPCYDDAVRIAKESNFFDKVGLHLDLDEYIPLSPCTLNSRLVCDNGQFRKTWCRGWYRFFLSKNVKELLRNEIESQMKRYVDSGFTLMHIDSHHHVHTILSLLLLIIPLAKKYEFKSMRICIMRKEDSFLKKIYKSLINRFISVKFHTLEACIPYGIYSKEIKLNQVNSLEVMMHPDKVDGLIVDKGLSGNIVIQK